MTTTQLHETYRMRVDNVVGYGVFVLFHKTIAGVVLCHADDMSDLPDNLKERNLALKSLYRKGDIVLVQITKIDCDNQLMNGVIVDCIADKYGNQILYDDYISD